jgi:hypothetical protein
MPYNINAGIRSGSDIVVFVNTPEISSNYQQIGGTLEPNSTYYYKISAIDTQGGETKSSNLSTVNLSYSNQTSILFWPNISGAYTYKGYRSNTGDLNSWDYYDNISNPWIDTNTTSNGSNSEPSNFTNAFINRLSFNETSWLTMSNTIFKLSSTGIDIVGNVTIDGKAFSSQTDISDPDNTLITKKYFEDTVSTSAIGKPSNGTYTNDILLNITENYKIPDAFQSIDLWLKTNLIDTPPAPTLVTVSNDTSTIFINWNNPIRVELGFTDLTVPHIEEIIIQFKPNISSDIPANWNTISTGSDLTDSIEFWVENLASNGLTGTTWKQYGSILSNVAYDFEIYGINDNNSFDLHKLKNGLNFHLTDIIGITDKPTSVYASSITSTSLTLNWTKPNDHDLTTVGIQTSPFIGIYNIDISANTTTSYNGLHADDRTFTTSYIGTANSATSKAISSMKPGHTYDFFVNANNTQNNTGGTLSDGFSDNSILYQATTLEPNKPTALQTSDCNALNSVSTLRSPYHTASSTGAKNLDGSSLTVQNSINGLILRKNNLNDTNLRTTSASNRLNNQISASSDAITAELVAFGGNSSTFLTDTNSSINLAGFGQSSVDGTYNNGAVSLVISDDNDYYSSPSDGFWKKYDSYVKANDVATNYLARSSPYSFKLSYDPNGGSIVQTDTVTFYIDDIETAPVINTPLIYNISNVTEFVSGVSSYKSGAVVSFQFNIENISKYFLRHDLKHASVTIKGNSTAYGTTLNITQASIGSPDFYYDEPTTLYNTSTTKHNTNGLLLIENAGNIQFNTFTTSLTSLSDSKFDENIGIEITAYNLYQNGGTAIIGYPKDVSNNNNIGNFRIDTLSIDTKNLISSNTTVRGQHRKSTSHQSGFTGSIGDTFADENNMTVYDHTDAYPLTSNDELILANGLFRSVSDSGNYYKDYSVFYFDSISPVDYSDIGTGGKRYYSAYYTNVFTSEDDYITLKFIGQSGTWTGSTHSDISLNIKITGSSNNTDCKWMNANAPIEATGIGESNPNTQSNGVSALLLAGDSDNITDSVRKCIQLFPATSQNSKVWVRIGIDGTSDKSFKYIEVRKGKNST